MLLAGAGPFAAKTPLPACPTDRATIKGSFGTAAFNVELAADETSRARGLMHVEHLPLSSGMLFVYQRPQLMSFWMRNTLIELDMLFLDGFGVIRHIHHRAQPLDETPISGGPDMLIGVLEINGGLARRLGIKVGDVLRHPAFISTSEPWNC
ncbi:DUF192 domain-containing protein [Sulfitobacter sp.]|uniref:DUF192 domain-containing protein n=1 Tax=Sulfitobacter sp. TaxID=1903071 RepID=UPI0030035715